MRRKTWANPPSCGGKEKTWQSLAKAKEMIEEMGDHRRDGKLAELEGSYKTLRVSETLRVW